MRQLGIIGYPLTRTLSPKLMNRLFKDLQLDLQYTAYPVEKGKLKNILGEFRKKEFLGFNITIPYKEEIIPYLNRIENEKIGSVNTVINEAGQFWGYNTDSYGFIESLKAIDYDPQDKKLLILGAGGAAKAVVFALKEAKKITVVSRNHKFLGENIKVIPWERKLLQAYILESDLLINATPLGSEKNEVPSIPYEAITKKHLVYDLIYNPKETMFLKLARERGAKTTNGALMFIYQAQKALEIWLKEDFTTPLFRLAKKLEIIC